MVRIAYIFLFFLISFSVSANGYLPYDNSHITNIDGLKIHYRYWEADAEQPEGSCLLVHGFGGSTFSWEQVADSLQQLGFDVIAIDVPPFGYSDKSPHINQAVTAHAGRLQTFIHEQFPGRSWHLAGHSMGGAVVQAYALLYPDDLESVTFVSAALFSSLPRSESSTNALLRLSPVRFLLGEFAEEWLLTDSNIERLLTSAYGQEPTEEQVKAYLEPLTIPGTIKAILSAPAYHEYTASLDAADLETRSLAIWGDVDELVPVESREPSLEKMPETELILLEGVGHNPMETHFEQLIEAWIPFLEGPADN